MSIKKKTVVAIVTVALAIGWMAFIDHIRPDRADAVVVCSDTNPCEYPTASKKKYAQYKNDKLGHTSTKQIKSILSHKTKRKMKHAYRLWVIDQEQNATPAERRIGWPSPRDWLSNMMTDVRCATVGAAIHYQSAQCASNDHDWYRKVHIAMDEATWVTIKCGGAAVLGGVNSDGKSAIKKAFGVGVRGGWGMVGFGGACLWNEYFDNFKPW